MRSPEEYTRGLTGTNDKYNTKANLGTYRTSDEQFPDPEGMVYFTGFGANSADCERGFCEPDIKELPDYDKANYHDRYSQPRLPDEDQGNRDFLMQDMEFRMKERETKGFLTRPRIPIER